MTAMGPGTSDIILGGIRTRWHWLQHSLSALPEACAFLVNFVSIRVFCVCTRKGRWIGLAKEVVVVLNRVDICQSGRVKKCLNENSRDNKTACYLTHFKQPNLKADLKDETKKDVLHFFSFPKGVRYRLYSREAQLSPPAANNKLWSITQLIGRMGCPTKALSTAQQWRERKTRWGKTQRRAGGCVCRCFSVTLISHSIDLPGNKKPWYEVVKTMNKMEMVCFYFSPPKSY